METLLFILFTLLGIAIGSFLNVVIDRLPSGGSLIYPPSRCDACGNKLAIKDLVPIFSYLWLQGRCRYCGTRVPARVLLVEVLTGLLFFLAFWRLGLSYEFAYAALFGSIFLVIIFIDWENKLILNKITYPAAGLALILLAADMVFPGWGITDYIKTYWPASGILSIGILNGIIAGAIGFGFFLIIFIINPRGMGMGDIKLAGLIGLVTGFPLFIIAMFLGIVLGGIVAVLLLVFKIKGRKDVIPYGTFLGIGPIITLLWGNDILSWYITLL